MKSAPINKEDYDSLAEILLTKPPAEESLMLANFLRPVPPNWTWKENGKTITVFHVYKGYKKANPKKYGN